MFFVHVLILPIPVYCDIARSIQITYCMQIALHHLIKQLWTEILVICLWKYNISELSTIHKNGISRSLNTEEYSVRENASFGRSENNRLRHKP